MNREDLFACVSFGQDMSNAELSIAAALHRAEHYRGTTQI